KASWSRSARRLRAQAPTPRRAIISSAERLRNRFSPFSTVAPLPLQPFPPRMPPYRAKTWAPTWRTTGRDQIHALTGLDGFQKKRDPYVGSQPFSASRAACQARAEGVRRQMSPLVTDSKAWGWKMTPAMVLGNLGLFTRLSTTAAMATIPS